MEYTFFILMILLLAYVLYRNMNMLGRYRHNKEYIECYQKMLSNDENAYDAICKYIEKEKSAEFISKANVLKIHEELERNMDCKQTLDGIDLAEIFTVNGKLNQTKLTMNTDVFIWLYMDMAKARQLSRFDVMNALNEKMGSLPVLENRVEYKLFKAINNALNETGDGGIEFLNQLLDGSYYDLSYDKNLIGLYKRFASSTLAYANEPMDEYFKEDLHSFAATSIGENYMKDLEIYDKYLPVAQEEKENEENKEA